MPFGKLTDEQLLAVVAAYDRIMEIPWVTMLEVDFVGPRRTEPGLVVYVDVDAREGIGRLPTAIAGVPVIAKIENRKTCQIIETIDPRRTGGEWPVSQRGSARRR